MTSVNLFGIPITTTSYSEFIGSCLEREGYTCFLNVHMFHEHKKNPAFQNVLKDAAFVVPDGMPIALSIKLLHGIKQERIAGPDVIFSLVNKAEKESLKVFLIGSTDEVLNQISLTLNLRNVIHQTYSPPFQPIDDFDFEHQALLINTFAPDMVLVGLGCPKQEIWMHRMRNKLHAPMFGLGGAFPLFVGIDNRAPEWMRKLSLEWFYRLLLEPKRLFKRYLTTNSYFLWLMLKHAFTKRDNTR